MGQPPRPVAQCRQFPEDAKDASVSECTWTLGALEALRNALYKFKTYLLTYFLTVYRSNRFLVTLLTTSPTKSHQSTDDRRQSSPLLNESPVNLADGVTPRSESVNCIQYNTTSVVDV